MQETFELITEFATWIKSRCLVIIIMLDKAERSIGNFPQVWLHCWVLKAIFKIRVINFYSESNQALVSIVRLGEKIETVA